MSEKNQLNDQFKEIPEMQFDKITMDDLGEIEELNEEYQEVLPKLDNRPKLKKGEHYKETNYKTIKEIYLHTMKHFANNTLKGFLTKSQKVNIFQNNKLSEV